ncbi:MAG: hypothetical protein MJY64_03800, partial [archaeon]|nr:hypothetical protein [archaeon]
MCENVWVATRLKEIIPYDYKMYHISGFESIDGTLLCNKGVLLSLIPRIEPVVETDDDYYIYLCLLVIVETAKRMINKG